MADSSSSSSSSGIGLFGLLTVIFVVMKCMGWGVVAGWSWWLVFSPMLVGIGILLVVIFFAVLFAAIAD